MIRLNDEVVIIEIPRSKADKLLEEILNLAEADMEVLAEIGTELANELVQVFVHSDAAQGVED